MAVATGFGGYFGIDVVVGVRYQEFARTAASLHHSSSLMRAQVRREVLDFRRLQLLEKKTENVGE